MIEINYNENEGILYAKSYGIISLNDMFKSTKFVENNPSLPKNLKIMEDACKAQVLFNEHDIHIIIEKLKNNMIRFNNIRHAVIQTDPKNTAYVMIAEGLIKGSNYDLQVFSTYDAAWKWLKMSQ